MDARSDSEENAHVIIMDSTSERHAQEGSQSFHEIPEVSLCPPDSPDMEDLHRTSSPSQLYHQVPQDCPHHSQCHCCRNRQPITDSTFPATASPHPDCLSSPVKTTHSRSSSHMPSCHDTVQCHWLQGSHDDGVHQPVQHHIVTVRHEGLHRIPRRSVISRQQCCQHS
ncbi:hypothetical protein SKAU_G00211610 [Synaphobranchus kaupii]|uniref:Uncharacterized protein n=1 Tax=Synaphobranchus kaupii TaxID=118154 RepID=A0A9Q1F917_SYNKA|nr:hypothetical protein SKAU_G00211610 [Synaphobranchus kaupii]